MVAIPSPIRSLIESGRLAHLVTINPDGSPQASGIWIGLDGDEIVSGHLSESRKVVNIRRDPRLVLTIEAGTRNEMGLDEYLIIRGTGRISAGGAPELLQRLAHVYMGPDVVFPSMPHPPAGYVLHITPARYGGVGPWRS
jgi:PPOX class probable F420-dependent enzyme